MRVVCDRQDNEVKLGTLGLTGGKLLQVIKVERGGAAPRKLRSLFLFIDSLFVCLLVCFNHVCKPQIPSCLSRTTLASRRTTG